MLELDQEDHYFYDVSGHNLTAEGIKRPFDFKAMFKRLESDRLDELFNEQERDPLTNAAVRVSDIEIAKEVLIGWEGVRNKGEPVAFTPEYRDRLIANHRVLNAVITAWMASLKDGVGKISPRRRHG